MKRALENLVSYCNHSAEHVNASEVLAAECVLRELADARIAAAQREVKP